MSEIPQGQPPLESPELLDHQLDMLHHRAASAMRITRVITGLSMMASGQVVELASKASESMDLVSRNELQEPWDWPDHVGNFTEAGLYTGVAFSFANRFFEKRNGGVSEKTIRHGALTGFVVSSVIQVVGEKYIRAGLNTGDMVDAAYGVAWSALVATAGSKGYKKTLDIKAGYKKRVDALLAEHDYDAPEVNVARKESVANGGTKKAPVNHQAKKQKRRQQKQSRRKNR